jgi:hypothetical protein
MPRLDSQSNLTRRSRNLIQGHIMKRSRRVVLTMMGTAAIGTVSMGFARRGDCGPGLLRDVARGADGRLAAACEGVAYGGFGGGAGRFHGHGHAHGGG